MEKEENYSAALPGSFPVIDYSLDHHHHHQIMRPQIGDTSSGDNTHHMVDYLLNNPQQQHMPSGFCDVLQFSDFGPKLALNQTKEKDQTGIDPVYFLKFPVLNDHKFEDDESLMVNSQHLGESDQERFGEDHEREDEEARCLENTTSVQLNIRVLGENLGKSTAVNDQVKNKRKRPRSVKTSEEVESQRMTHIAVERNRRKQMNEHLRVLRSLMPGSYVQRGDQASIIGGAIEFVRELEQLLQCLESQKRRRLYGDTPRPTGDSSLAIQQPQPPFLSPMPLPNDQINFETGLYEETAESKSCLADVEVKLLGFDAIIKILCRRRPGQLIRTIAALEDLQLNILHTNITTIEQTVLYSFNVKVASEARFTAEDIASSVQQIFSFIHTNSSI